MVVTLEFLQGIIRDQGGKLSFGLDDELARLLESGGKVANRWVLAPAAIRAMDVELGNTIDTDVYALIGAWQASSLRARETEAIISRVREIMRAIQTTPRPAAIAQLILDSEIEIEWSESELFVKATITSREVTS